MQIIWLEDMAKALSGLVMLTFFQWALGTCWKAGRQQILGLYFIKVNRRNGVIRGLSAWHWLWPKKWNSLIQALIDHELEEENIINVIQHEFRENIWCHTNLISFDDITNFVEEKGVGCNIPKFLKGIWLCIWVRFRVSTYNPSLFKVFPSTPWCQTLL